jgi:hypothetical protein
MKIALLLLVNNEIDILHSWWRWHRDQQFDAIYIMDNASIDGTREYIGDVIAQDGRVKVFDEPSDDYRQRDWCTGMAWQARDEGADYIVSTDTDEMWRCMLPGGWPEFFEKHKDNDQTMIQPYHYRVTAEDDENEIDPVKRICYREKETRREWQKNIFRSQAHDGRDLYIYRGNHYAVFGDRDGDDRGRAGVAPVEDAYFCHYFSRGFDHYARKAIIRGEWYITHGGKFMKNEGWHLRQLYDIYKKSGRAGLYEHWVQNELGKREELIFDPLYGKV